jgi:hypothetical protein
MLYECSRNFYVLTEIKTFITKVTLCSTIHATTRRSHLEIILDETCILKTSAWAEGKQIKKQKDKGNGSSSRALA